jgi:GntR family transcriptional regulator, transcriptional repressor for pyruvate dehydrogenase complex
VAESNHLSAIPRANLTEEILQRILSLVNDLRPGDKLPTERELIATFRVGRSSVREALKILSAIGVVRIVSGAGTFVGNGNLSLLAKPLSLQFLKGGRGTAELIEARRVLEIELAGLAAERATAEEIGAIEDALVEMEATQQDIERYIDSEIQFHLAIARAAHNHVLLDLLQTLQYIVRRWMVQSIEEFEGRPSSIHEHVPIRDAIKAHDLARARTAMSEHLAKAGWRLLQTATSNSR